MSQIYDAAIVGAGPGGSAAAHYLAKAGLSVLLLDKFDFPRDKTCGDGLTPRAVGVLHDMGVLGDVLQAGRRINGLEIFAPRSHSTAAPIPQPAGQPGYALVVPRLILDNLLRERAMASGARFEGRVHVTAVEQSEQGVLVRGGRYGRSVTAKAHMAILATGASPKLLLHMGLLPAMPPMMLAARTYFEGVGGLEDRIHLRFDGVPLPGYGWVFPVSDSAANIGAGFFTGGRAAGHMPATPGAAFEDFVRIPPLQAMLAGAHQVGPVKGHPLRVDFATAPTFGERIMLVGEAAGLVNPLTGEGIDYALESGKLAAEHLVSMFAAGDLSRQALAAYDQLLRQHFQRLFVFCNTIRDVFVHRRYLNRLVKAATRYTDLRTLLSNVVLGNQDVSTAVSLRTMLRTFFALAAIDFH
jgi:geranylgeranyl reductase family protein